MKTKLSKMIIMVLVFAMAASMMIVSCAAATYTVDLNKFSEKQWNDSKVRIRFNDGEWIYGDEDLGNPVLLDVDNIGTITFIPIRLICNALNVPVEWVDKTDLDIAHAELTTPKGLIKLYLGATEITAQDCSTYKEETYTFPDGSAIPLCLMRNNRIYVPVRFISSFIMTDATYQWSDNGYSLTVKGQLGNIKETWDGYGVNSNTFPNGAGAAEAVMPSFPNTIELFKLLGYEDSEIPQLFSAGKGGGTRIYTTTVQNVNGAVNITGYEPSLALGGTTHEVFMSVISDVVDKESYDAIRGWFDKIEQNWMNYVVERTIKEDAFRYNCNMLYCSGTMKMGNVLVTPLFDGEPDKNGNEMFIGISIVNK